MRTIRTTTISILAVGLLAGSAVGVAAQDADAEPLAPSDFGLSITGYREGERPGMSHMAEGHAETGPVAVTGLALVGRDEEGWPAPDPRALGSVTEVWNQYDTTADNAIMVARGSTRVENDGGAWVGTAERYALGVGVELGTVVWELVGEGGYEGLTMYLWGEYRHKPEDLTGVIVPSANVPDFPPMSSD